MLHLQRARELDPQNLDTYINLPLVLEPTGKPEEAVKLAEGLGPSGMLATVYVRAGRRSQAHKLIPQLKDPWDLSVADMALGDTNRALQAITTAINRREFNAALFKTDPTFDPLRSDPRFQHQVARLRIPDTVR